MGSSSSDCFYLGKIVRKHGYKGDLVLKLDTDVPESYAELDNRIKIISQETIKL